MSEYLSPFALTMFPKQTVPGHIPYKHVSDYILQGEDFPVAYALAVQQINLKGAGIINPQELDTLFLYIQTCIEKNEFPKGLGKKTQLWFKEIFPYCNRHVYSVSVPPNSVLTDSSQTEYKAHLQAAFERELAFLKFRAEKKSPLKERKSEETRLISLMSPEEKTYFLSGNGNVLSAIPHTNWCYDIYILNTPDSRLPNLWLDPTLVLSVPQKSIWEIFIQEMKANSFSNQ